MNALKITTLRAGALLLPLLASAAMAQAAGGGEKLNSLGAANPKAKVMSREELRACFKQQDELKARSQDAITQRSALDAERKQLEYDNEALKTERDGLAAKAERVVNEMNAKVAAHAETVAAFNQKMDALNAAMKKGDNVERRRVTLEREGTAMQARSEELNNQNTAVQAELANDQTRLKAKFAAFEARIADWNQRNKQMEPVAAAYDDDQAAWKTRCGGRNYRESDADAIRAGK